MNLAAVSMSLEMVLFWKLLLGISKVRELTELNKRIKDAKEDIETVHCPFLGRGARIDDIEAMEEQKERKRYLDNLLQQREKVELSLSLIDDYIKKATK